MPLPPEAAGFGTALYYAGRSFAARRDLFKAALDEAEQLVKKGWFANGPDADTLTFLRQAVLLASAYSQTRNKLAHRSAMFNATAERMELVEGDEWADDGLLLADLSIIEENFESLKWLLAELLAPSPLTPQEALKRLNIMPREASSEKPSRSGSKRRRRPRSSRG